MTPINLLISSLGDKYIRGDCTDIEGAISSQMPHISDKALNERKCSNILEQ